MKEKTTKSNDSSNELEIESLDSESLNLYNKAKGYNFEIRVLGFEPEVQSKTQNDINMEELEEVITTRNGKIKIVKHGRLRFINDFLKKILKDGLTMHLKGKALEKARPKAKPKKEDEGKEK